MDTLLQMVSLQDLAPNVKAVRFLPLLRGQPIVKTFLILPRTEEPSDVYKTQEPFCPCSPRTQEAEAGGSHECGSLSSSKQL